MQEHKNKQSCFNFSKIIIDSQFQSGNLQKVQMPAQNQFSLWIGSDPNANYKTWFYFSIQGVKQGTTVTFTIMNMNNQVKLLKEGHLPVFRSQNSKDWRRITTPIPVNTIIKSENGFLLTFKHTFLDNSKHYFAFTYPWTNKQNQMLIQRITQKINSNIFIKTQQLCLSYKGRPVTLLTITKSHKNKQLEFKNYTIGNNQFILFPERKGIFMSARVHPGETASSYIINGIIKNIILQNQLTKCLLQYCVFYILPIINPDGVAEGNFRTDSQGKNLNRYYTNPNPQTEPQIFYIKQFLVEMIKNKNISFCLDLHAHVNKQNAFMYGNSTNNLYSQMKVCLFPKLLSFNSQFFDFDSCNFSQKNMSSKDKGDELSKEGASRVAIFKDTGLVECWTLQCNYNSAKLVHNLLQPMIQNKANNISNGTLCSKIEPELREQIKYLDIKDFQSLGLSILESIADFYNLKPTARIFASKIKNMHNLQLNIAITALRLIPYRFDTQCRKILDNINSSINIKGNIQKLAMIIAAKGQKIIQPTSLSIRNIKSDGQGSNSIKKIQKSLNNKRPNIKLASLPKGQNSESNERKSQKRITAIKTQQKLLKAPLIMIPNIPKSTLIKKSQKP